MTRPVDRIDDCYHCGEPLPGGPPIVARLEGKDQPMCYVVLVVVCSAGAASLTMMWGLVIAR